VDCLSPTIVDSIAIAKKNNAILWTDDMLTGAVASQANVQRIWSQVVLTYAKNNDANWLDKYKHAESNMFIWGYDFTIVCVDTIIRLFQENQWKYDNARGTRIFDFMERFGANHKKNCQATCLLIADIWLKCAKREAACRIILEILERIGREKAISCVARPLYRGQITLPPSRRIGSLKRMLRNWRSKGN